MIYFTFTFLYMSRTDKAIEHLKQLPYEQNINQYAKVYVNTKKQCQAVNVVRQNVKFWVTKLKANYKVNCYAIRNDIVIMYFSLYSTCCVCLRLTVMINKLLILIYEFPCGNNIKTVMQTLSSHDQINDCASVSRYRNTLQKYHEILLSLSKSSGKEMSSSQCRLMRWFALLWRGLVERSMPGRPSPSVARRVTGTTNVDDEDTWLLLRPQPTQAN